MKGSQRPIIFGETPLHPADLEARHQRGAQRIYPLVEPRPLERAVAIRWTQEKRFILSDIPATAVPFATVERVILLPDETKQLFLHVVPAGRTAIITDIFTWTTYPFLVPLLRYELTIGNQLCLMNDALGRFSVDARALAGTESYIVVTNLGEFFTHFGCELVGYTYNVEVQA